MEAVVLKKINTISENDTKHCHPVSIVKNMHINVYLCTHIHMYKHTQTPVYTNYSSQYFSLIQLASIAVNNKLQEMQNLGT